MSLDSINLGNVHKGYIISKPKKNRRFNRFNDAFVKYILSNKLLLINLLNAIFAEYRPPCVKGDITDVTSEIPRRLYAPHSPIFTRFCMAISA